MADQKTPKSRARAIIKAYMAKPGATIETDLFCAFAEELAAVERETLERAAKVADDQINRVDEGASDIAWVCNREAEDIATAIRALKQENG